MPRTRWESSSSPPRRCGVCRSSRRSSLGSQTCPSRTASPGRATGTHLWNLSWASANHPRRDRVSESLAAASGTFVLGGDLPVVRLGYGTMQLPGKGVWGPPRDHDEAIRVLRRAVDLGI